jgi:simple sugar transport system permease protein
MSHRGRIGSRLGGAVTAGLVAVGASGLLVAMAGVPPLDAYDAVWTGGLGSTSAWGTTSVTTLPLLFAALAFAVPFRAGLYNIGIEGQLYLGALASTVVGLKLHAPGYILLPLAVLAGMAAGMAWAVIPALLKVSRGVNEIVSSLFLSYVAIFFTNYLLAGPLAAPNIGVAQTEIVPPAARFPTLVDGTKITWAVTLALAVLLLVQLLFRTPFGFELQIMGGSRKAARYVGIPVGRATVLVFAISGALGGLAGTVEVLGNQFFLAQDFSPGWGYTGIAVAVLGGAGAWGISLAAVFFGLISSAGLQMRLTNQLSPSFALVVQAVAVVAVLLVIDWRHRRTPRSVARAPARAQEELPAVTATEVKA